MAPVRIYSSNRKWNASLFVSGKYYITGEQIRTVQMVCMRGLGLKFLQSMKIFHLITPLRITVFRQCCLTDRLTWLWLTAQRETLLQGRVYGTFSVCSALFSSSVLAHLFSMCGTVIQQSWNTATEQKRLLKTVLIPNLLLTGYLQQRKSTAYFYFLVYF